MEVYSTEQSLYDEWGQADVEGILNADLPTRDTRLEKAAESAAAEINAYLGSGGYIVPFVFTAYGGNPPVDGSAPLLDAKIQAISDAFTMWHLANRDDFNRKKYDDARAEGLAWLEKVRDGSIRILLNGVVGPTGSGNVRVITRPRVFDRNLKRECDIFGPNRG